MGLRYGIQKKPIPDSGVKKAPDLGSATLTKRNQSNQNLSRPSQTENSSRQWPSIRSTYFVDSVYPVTYLVVVYFVFGERRKFVLQKCTGRTFDTKIALSIRSTKQF
jgi:hypothetical protein